MLGVASVRDNGIVRAMLQSLTANGMRFAYLEAGRGPLVLLVHGFPDTPHTFRDVMPALARSGFRAVSPYTRGYFPSEVPKDGRYDTDTLGRDILAWIEALGETRAIVVGHDWGAYAAYAAAGLAPERIRFLATVALPHPAAVRVTPRLIWGLRHVFAFKFRSGEAKLRANDFALVDELVQRWSPVWKVPPDETSKVKECFAQPESLSAALGYYRALRPGVSPGLRQRITVPSAVFAGTDDPYFDVEDYEHARVRFTARHEIIDLPGGHFLHREHSARFVTELLRVVSSAPP